MKGRTRMFKDMENAPELFGKLRSIINYPLGAYHGVTWADSGIASMDDIKGKKVFIGPPAGAAKTVVTQVIRGVTGYEPNEDYEAINLDWSSAAQAFQDRQLDVYFVPTPIPSAELTQISALGQFRVLGIPDDKVDSDGVKAAASIPGREFNFLEPGAYDGLVNKAPVRMVSSVVGLGTHQWMSEDVVYAITKAIFENHGDFVEAAQWMETITPENALNQMNAPLHPGAYRYYREIGVDVPDALTPPEVK